MPRRALRIGAALAALAGLAAMLGLTAWEGFGTIGAVLASAGWGIALVIAFHMVPTAAAAIAWQVIAAALEPGARFWVFLRARMLREAVNGLLPVAQIGGNIVGARVLTFNGHRALTAGASVIADVTIEVLAQAAFTMIGIAALLMLGGGRLAAWAGAGLAVAVLACAGLLLAQRWGMFRLVEQLLGRMADRLAWPELGALARLHETVMALYRDRRVMARTATWHMATWFLDAVEIWIAFRVVGAEIGFAEALVIESLAQAIRSAAFAVPGALGVQEGGYMLLGAHFGLGAETALAVSLIKRVRDLALGVPVILIWQLTEGRRLIGPVRSAGGDRRGMAPAAEPERRA